MAPDAAHPPFEGPEKRLDVCFTLSPPQRDAGAPTCAQERGASLRDLPRASVDRLLRAAACSVLSVTSDDAADAYLLSESSLFVFHRRFLIKTCGTTTLLRALPMLLDMAAALGLQMSFLQYSRAAYLFPALQHFPHDTFAHEASYLDSVLGPERAGVSVVVEPEVFCEKMSSAADGEKVGGGGGGGGEGGGEGEVAGDAAGVVASCATKWHLYVADLAPASPSQPMLEHHSIDCESDIGSESSSAGSEPVHTDSCVAKVDEERQALEIFMYDLDRRVMDQFCGNGRPDSEHPSINFETDAQGADASGTTKLAGIDRLIRADTVVDAFDFEPCGYSMNGLAPASQKSADTTCSSLADLNAAYYTIHISPEPEASYVSFETSLASAQLASLVARVVSVFKPSRFSVAFVGTPGCAALRASPEAPIDWQKLDKLLSRTFRFTGPAVSLAVSPRSVAAVASFSSVHDVPGPPLAPVEVRCCPNGSARLEFSEGDKRLLVRHTSVAPCMSSIVASVAKAVGARIMTNTLPASAMDAASLPSSTSYAGGDDASSSSSSLLSVESQNEGCVCELRQTFHVGPDTVSRDTVSEIVREHGPFERPMFVVDLGVVERRLLAARRSLGPRVGLRYAVHCNADPAIISVMNRMGVLFEAASVAEVDLLRRSGVEELSICFASPTVTTRTLAEIGLVRSVAVYYDGYTSPNLDPKKSPVFGLLGALAASGISAEMRISPGTANEALLVYEAAAAQGCRVETFGLDLAPDDAGLPGKRLFLLLEAGLETISQVLANIPAAAASTIKVSLGEQYPGARSAMAPLLDSRVKGLLADLPRVTIDAGRFIIGHSVALITSVIGRRRRSGESRRAFNYYLDDGVYGAFSSVVLELDGGELVHPSFFSVDGAIAVDSTCTEGTLFGPTCDALDRIWTGPLPELQVGDVVAFGPMGCYTGSATSQFNGFAQKFDTKHVVSRNSVFA